jgi:hypothetical protein
MQHLLQARGQPMYHFLHRFCFYMSHDSRPDNGTVRDKLDTFSVQVFFDAKLRPWTILQVGFPTCTVGRPEHCHQLLGVCSWRQGPARGKVSYMSLQTAAGKQARLDVHWLFVLLTQFSGVHSEQLDISALVVEPCCSRVASLSCSPRTTSRPHPVCWNILIWTSGNGGVHYRTCERTVKKIRTLLPLV